MQYISKEDPSINIAHSVLKEGLNYQTMISIAGDCIVEYDGRSVSYLPSGERLILIKGDGTVLVHKNENRNPVNWQNPGSEIETEINNSGEIIIHVHSYNPDETMKIVFECINTIQSYNLKDDSNIRKSGTENELQVYLMENPSEIENGFRAIEKEKSIGVGAIDIYGYDIDENPTVVELKRKKVGPEAVQQLRRYVENMETDSDGKIRGILIAPDVTDSAFEQIKSYDYTFIEAPEVQNVNDVDKITA